MNKELKTLKDIEFLRYIVNRKVEIVVKEVIQSYFDSGRIEVR